MGIYDRDYGRPHQEQYYSMGTGFRSITPMVKWLLIINLSVFVIDGLLFKDLWPEISNIRFTLIDQYFSVFPKSLFNSLQIWRVITYQFLHADLGHVFFNMFALYMFGQMVERAWGSRAFLKFYLICGAAGGILYTIFASVGILGVGTMVGASGAIYGIFAAAAILYPRTKVYVMMMFPMRIGWMVVLMIIMSFMFIFEGKNVGGELAHLSGLGMGFLYVKYKPLLTRFRMERRKGAWEQKIEQERNFQSQVDQILTKVHRDGINSLSANEKKILQEATRREQQQ